MLKEESLSAVARRLDVNKGLIPYVLDGNHSPTLLTALNMPVYQKREVPICMECGHVHTMHKSCETKRRVQIRFRKSADMESAVQQNALEEIATSNGFDNFTAMCRQMAKWHLNGLFVIIDGD
jgi:hypothetical protein